MSDMFLGSQAPLYQNVCIRRRSKTGKILEERHAKNRVTRLMLYGIGKFLLGQFNDSSPDKIYEYIPRYLALGTNTPGEDASTVGVTNISTVNDTRLLNEIKVASTTGASESIKRVWIAERNMCKLNTKFSDPFIKVSIKTYISSNHYDGMSIGEAGLFSKEKDNNCLARVCFNPIAKNPGEVLDIQWDITLLSYGETKYAEKLEISNGSKITLPLRYTSKFFKEIDLHLEYNSGSKTLDYNSIGYFLVNEDGSIESTMTLEEAKRSSEWCISLQNEGIDESLFESIFNQLINSKLSDINNPYYLIDKNNNVPNMIHFGNLYTNENTISLPENRLAITLMYNEDLTYDNEDTEWKYAKSDENNNYTVYSPNNDTNIYKIVNNRFYKKNPEDESSWMEANAFLYNGIIVDINQKELGYSYSNNKFYKTKTITNAIYTNEYLNYSNIFATETTEVDERLHIYQIDSFNTIQRTGFTIDMNDDQKIYLNNEYTDYHLSVDGFWVSGDYEKLTPIITPKDATDKSINWFIQNRDVAKINWDGVVTAWNLGETTAIASTTNDLRAKCIVEVVRDTKYIDVDSITLDPSELTMFVDGDANQYYVITATIDPLFATNSSVNWSISSELTNCISLINLGNNRVKVVLSGTGNIGVGYIIASSQSGKTAECFVNVLYKADNEECNCEDISHLQQEG